MFSELPKLFDRDFAIGYFLPMACFLGVFYGIMAQFHHTELIVHLVKAKETDVLIGTTLIGLATWLAGVALLAGNRSVYQLFEGYCWPLNTAWGKRREEKRFQDLTTKIDDAYAIASLYRSKNKPVPNELLQKQADLLIIRAESFPYRKRDILATKFGNTIRAFETYAKAMYGIDTIEGWFRLLTVVPKDYRQMIDSAKAQTNFWLNLWFLSYITVGCYALFVVWLHYCPVLWFLILVPAIVLIVIARTAAIAAAKEWGAIFKASFDVFLPELNEKLCFALPSDANTIPKENTDEENLEWKMWDAFSKAITYRDPSQLPPRQLMLCNSKPTGGENATKSTKGEGDKEEDNSPESSDDAGDTELDDAVQVGA